MILTLSRLDVLSERLIEFAAKASSSIKIDRRRFSAIAGPSMAPLALEAINRVAMQSSTKKSGKIFCRLCGKGPFTKRGMYLHLIRVHRYELKVMIADELEKILNERS